ncbi:unnamed protein product [Symbiodinium pilosum]|uniref:Uncharacterized protein n=1 Tax=Symbiodinium pilosum TaxID=2952 RepID=A0A812NBT9_SYMPI|nr:unnamed protein product [Symbiodinium pilosum]
MERYKDDRSLLPADGAALTSTPAAQTSPLLFKPPVPATTDRTLKELPSADALIEPAMEEWWLGVDDATRQRLTDELHNWLRCICPSFTCYFQTMEENYDTVDQICRLYLVEEEDGERKPEKRLDPLFFEDNKISDPEHQRLFRQWFAENPDFPSHVSGHSSSSSNSGKAAKAKADPAAAPAKAEAKQAFASTSPPAPAEQAGAARRSLQGEDPWTTGKDPWTRGREEAAVRSRSQPPTRTESPRPGSGTERAASLRPPTQTQPAGAKLTAAAELVRDAGHSRGPALAAKPADAVATGRPELAVTTHSTQVGSSDSSPPAYNWGDTAWSPGWSSWSWSWNGWGSRSGW